MGFVEFILFCLFVLVVAWLGVWAIGYFAPGHPDIVDKLIWIIAVVVILLKFLNATNLVNFDIQIPHFR